MDGQAPGPEYYEYYYAGEQTQPPTYHDRDREAEGLRRHPQVSGPSALPSTSHPAAYGPHAAVDDGTEQFRVPPIPDNSGNSTYSPYPLHMARSPATAAHPVPRQNMQQLDGAGGDITSYGGTFFQSQTPSESEGVYGTQRRGIGYYPSINPDQNDPTELQTQPAVNVVMGLIHTSFPQRHLTETPPHDPSTPHGGELYTQSSYSSPHTLASSSHRPIHRPTFRRQSVRVREGPAIIARSRSACEPYQWVHAQGPDMPHSVASPSTKPAQRYFRTLHDSQTPIADGLDEYAETGPSNVSALSSTSGDPTPPATSHPTPSLAPLRTLNDMYEYFPEQSLRHELMRARLLEVMNASWRRMNEKEPDSQILLQFTDKIDENGSEKHKCLICIEGRECGKKIPRSDRMLEHLRRHLAVRPFACDCNSEGCPGVFPSKSAMYQHQKNVEPVQCHRCVCVKTCPDIGGPSGASIQPHELCH